MAARPLLGQPRMLPWLRARVRAPLDLLTDSFPSFISISRDTRLTEGTPRWITRCGRSLPCPVLRAAGGFGLGLSTGTGVVGEPRWKRPLQGGVLSSANEAPRGQNNLKAGEAWRGASPSESARSRRRLDFPFHISHPVYSLLLTLSRGKSGPRWV